MRITKISSLNNTNDKRENLGTSERKNNGKSWKTEKYNTVYFSC